MIFRNMSLQKKLDILLVLITFSWTVGAALVLVGLGTQDNWQYLESFVFFGNGFVFLWARRKIRGSYLSS